MLTWSVRELNGTRRSFLTFHGTKADLFIDRRGYSSRGQKWQHKEPVLVEDRDSYPPDAQRNLNQLHLQNFFSCVKSRQKPSADIEIGHRTAIFCHLGNIATRLGRSLQ